MTQTRNPAITALARLLFFGWNALFLCIMGAGFVPVVWWNLMQDSLHGRVPLDFVVFSNVAVLIPVLATLLGVRLWRSPWRLLRLFYCVELPLFMSCLYRIFGIHELTLGSGVLFGFIALGALAQLFSLLRVAPPPGAWRYLDLSFRTLSLGASVYTALLASFFVIPTLFVIAESLSRAIFLLLPMSFFVTSSLVLCLWPVVSTVASLRGFVSSSKLIARSRSRGPLRVFAVSSATIALTVSAFALLPPQPQRVAKQMFLQSASLDDADRARQLRDREILRAGYVNAYLARHRYVADRTVTEGAVRSAYWHEVGIPLEYAEALQGAWNWLVSPLLYDGELHEDRGWAMIEYARFFDEPIERAERTAIMRALSATFRREDREAGLLDVDRQRVRLAEQEIDITQGEGYADVEIHEVYENQTYDQEEIAYYFSLPESAVITGLWLGESADLARRHRFVVAPRGAAQAVYKAEVQRRVDPALLEQVGPRQYRLRAFPIPPRPYRTSAELAQPRMHLWLSYRTLPQAGVWPLPELAEKRNVYFDQRSARRLNGTSWSSDEDWMPAPPRSVVAAPDPTRIALGQGAVMRVRPVPAEPAVEPLTGRALVIIDRSYSMGAHAAALAEAVQQLESAAQSGAELHYVLGPTHDRPNPEVAGNVDVRELIFFGSSRSSDLIAAALSEVELTSFDVIFVLTDEGSYETESDAARRRDLGLPIYWVHLGGRLPRAYDDTTLETIQRQGGAAVSSIREALSRHRVHRRAEVGFVSLVDGVLFELVSADGTETEGPLGALAARQLVAGAMRTGQSSGLEDLDRMHALAKRFEIVTPYSSMLVLVEDRQREALARAEKSDDRFEREVEHGAENGGPNITGTPEPEEWALFLFGLALLYLASRKRLAPSGRFAH